MPYWVQGAIIRAVRTFVITAIGVLAAVPFIGLTVEEYLRVLGVAVLPAALAGLDKAFREFRIERSNSDLSNDPIEEVPGAQPEP